MAKRTDVTPQDTGEPGCMERFDGFMQAALQGVCANARNSGMPPAKLALQAWLVASEAARIRAKIARRLKG